ncbi:hypothetical protein ACG1BZ_13990 [Microbulbifer sp. CNSA002]|uniref:hypothetical protein n=1 Tax=Microbulbifer sp. CNSA002 TaxID=3373604 RepID=UPI0039B46B2C
MHKIYISLIAGLIAATTYLYTKNSTDDANKQSSQTTITGNKENNNLGLERSKQNHTKLEEYTLTGSTVDVDLPPSSPMDSEVAIGIDLNNEDSEAAAESVLCADKIQNHSCNIRLDIDLAEILIDENLNAASHEEIGLVINSKNYKDVMSSIPKLLSENIMKSEDFNQLARFTTANLNIEVESVFSCNTKLCAAEHRVKNDQDWKSFEANFFTGDSAGNLFVSYDPNDPNIRRSILVFGEGAPVIFKKQ